MAEPALYLATLDPGVDEVARLANLIDDDERQRAAQFHFEADRRRFIVRRGHLRELLGERIGEKPARLRFEAGSHGKPGLPGNPCRFSLSHSGERMLLAIGDHELGCDIERIVDDFDWRPVAERFFTVAEQRDLLALPECEGRLGFFRCWTRKEAFVKGLGLGLSYPLDAFDVSVGEDACFLSGSRGWSLDGGMIEPGYMFALATPA